MGGAMMMQPYDEALFREMFTGIRGRLRTYVFELAAAAGYVFVGVAFLADPQVATRSAVGRTTQPWQSVWSIAYVLAGVAIFYGVLYARPRVRAVALITLGTGLLVQTVAAASFALDFRELFNLTFAAACFYRTWIIVRATDRYQGIQRHAPPPPGR